MATPDRDGEQVRAWVERARARRLPPFMADAARLRGLGWRGTDLAAALRATFEQELAERAGFQWLAVVFACGCLMYFSLSREPVLAVLVGAAAVALVPAILGYRRGTNWRIAAVVAVGFAGGTVAKLRVDSLAGSHIERELTEQVTARVSAVESRADRRPRVTLDAVRYGSGYAGPARIRLTVGTKQELPPLGAEIALLARLMPVPGPVVPGGYDPRRAAFFEGIGGSGFALGGWRLVAPHSRALDLVVPRVRAAIVGRIMAAEPGEAGAVAAALLVGERSALSEETNESLRRSGLAHILSISGLHMMLIAGAAFVAVRAALALSPRLALARPIRKWAAAAALLVVSLYFALSGGEAATVRAYVMAAVMFVAILLDRPAISMRNLAIAAFVVLALEPEGITKPGFQMSFAAVAALIAGWDVWHDRRRARLTDDDVLPGYWLARFLGRALLGVALTTLIAGLATAPFSAYHFERVATYSLLGNLLAAPLVSAIIMPFGLLTLIAMPFGLETPPLFIMARGIEALLSVSAWVAALPGAEVTPTAMSPASLVIVAAGMLWLCLWRQRWRLLGLPAIGFGLVLVPVLAGPPDMLVAPDGRAVAVRDATGLLRVSGSRAGTYAVEQLFDEERGPPPEGVELRRGVRCDDHACLLTAKGGALVSHVLDAAAFPEDCRRADVVVTPLAAPVDCSAELVIDRARLESHGAHAVRMAGGGDGDPPAFDLRTDRSAFPRPWQAGAER